MYIAKAVEAPEMIVQIGHEHEHEGSNEDTSLKKEVVTAVHYNPAENPKNQMVRNAGIDTEVKERQKQA